MQRLVSALFFVLSLLFFKVAAATEPGSELTISLLTMGPGDHPFTKFGHTAIWVHDASTGRDEVYNYGTFRFDSPTLLLDSVQGKLPYWLSVQSYSGTLLTYAEQGRSLLASELELTPPQRTELHAALKLNEQPEHRYYRYDYYRDNCATRVRDILDRSIGGQIHAQSNQPARMSFRAHTLRLVADSRPLYVGLDLGVGRETDVPITFWEEGFLPARLHDLVLATRLTRDGKSVPFVRSERVLLAGSLPLPAQAPPSWSLRYLIFGLALGGALVLLGRRRSSLTRRVLGLVLALLGIALGLLGCALAYLTFFSAHSAAAANYNVLLTPAWLLALIPAGIGVARGHESGFRLARWTLGATLVTTLLALALHLVTSNAQANGQLLAVAIPLWLSLAFGVWQHGPTAVVAHLRKAFLVS